MSSHGHIRGFDGLRAIAVFEAVGFPDDSTGPVSVGNPREFAMLQLAKLVLQMTVPKASSCSSRFPATIPASVNRIFLWPGKCSVGLLLLRSSSASNGQSNISGTTR